MAGTVKTTAGFKKRAAVKTRQKRKGQRKLERVSRRKERQRGK